MWKKRESKLLRCIWNAAADGIDAEIVQDNVECANLEEEIHPDYETQHPDFYAEKNKELKKLQQIPIKNKFDG